MEIIETVNLAKVKGGRLLYFGSYQEKLHGLGLITREDIDNMYTFFRAESLELIKSKVSSVERDCAVNTPLSKIPEGKEMEFLMGDPMRFRGARRGVIRIKNHRYVQIEIIPGEVYGYSYFDENTLKCVHLEIAP